MATCPISPEKIAYTSEKAAKRGLHGIKHPHGVMHVYPCGGHWHIGHTKELGRHRRRRTKRKAR